jgi:hypothetical protein
MGLLRAMIFCTILMVGSILIGIVLYDDYITAKEFCEAEGYDGVKYGFIKSQCYENQITFKSVFNSGQSLNISTNFSTYELPF